MILSLPIPSDGRFALLRRVSNADLKLIQDQGLPAVKPGKSTGKKMGWNPRTKITNPFHLS
jgi:hypothetical protein